LTKRTDERDHVAGAHGQLALLLGGEVIEHTERHVVSAMFFIFQSPETQGRYHKKRPATRQSCL